MSTIYQTARLLRRESVDLQIRIIKCAGFGLQVLLFCLTFLNSRVTLREAQVKIELGHETMLVVTSLLINVIFQVCVINRTLAQVRRQYELI